MVWMQKSKVWKSFPREILLITGSKPWNSRTQQERVTFGCNSPDSSITDILSHHVLEANIWERTLPIIGKYDQVLCRELLVVTGGYSWNSILARTEALNMTAEEGNRWRRLAPLLKPRYLHACSPVQLGTEVSAF